MSNLEQGLLAYAIVITILNLGFPLISLLKRKDIQQGKPDDE